MGSEMCIRDRIVDDGLITHLAIEAPGEIKVSSAEAILEIL